MAPLFTSAPLQCRGVFFAVRCRCSSSPIRQSRRFYRVHSALASSTANRARIPCVSRLFTPLSAFLTSPAGNHKKMRCVYYTGVFRGHFVASFLHCCCRWRKNRAKSRGFARSGALGLPGAGHGLAGGVLCVVYSSARILRNSLMGYAPVMLISLSWNTRK